MQAQLNSPHSTQAFIRFKAATVRAYCSLGNQGQHSGARLGFEIMKDHQLVELADFVLTALLQEDSLKCEQFEFLMAHVHSSDLLCEAHSFLGNLKMALQTCEQ